MSSTGKRSTIEMLGILAIFGVLTISGANIYANAVYKYKSNKLITQINTISSNIRTLYYAKNSYSGLNNALVIKTENIPQEMYSKNNTFTIKHAFGGEVIIKDTKIPISSLASNAYVIALKNLPRSACITAATTNWEGNEDKKLAAVYISDQDEDINPIINNFEFELNANENLGIPGDPTYGAPFSVNDAEYACNSENNNTIIITYI